MFIRNVIQWITLATLILSACTPTSASQPTPLVTQPAPAATQTPTSSLPLPTSTPTPARPIPTQTLVSSPEIEVKPTETLEPLERGQQLAEQGQLLYEVEPLLGLRLALEGWWLVPSGNEQIRNSILMTIQEMARPGRLLKLDDDEEEIFSSPDGTFFIFDWANASGELRRTSDFQIVAALTDEVNSPVSFSPDGAYFLVGYSSVVF